MRHIISLKEQSKDDILDLLDLAQKIKAKRQAGELTNYLENNTLIMLFQKTSTRTRLSFEAAMTDLGGHAIFLDAHTTQLGLADFKDEIQAIMRFGHVLMFRALKAKDVELAASYNRIPVIDACSEKYHPAQALSDLLTMTEQTGGVEHIKKVAWVGMEGNVSSSLMLMCAKLGIAFSIASPNPENPDIDPAQNEAALSTGKVMRTKDLGEALREAQFVHTDTWMNMEFFENGHVKPQFAEKYEQRKTALLPYQLNANLINTYAPNAKIMHCMPCHIGYEISRDAIDHPNSIIFDQAENRMHMQKAMILWLLEPISKIILSQFHGRFERKK